MQLYDLARKGREVERQPRPVTIYSLTAEKRLSDTDWALRVVCSKGTYVRTLCHDIGAALGCGGAMAALRRTEAAGFTLAQAYTLDQVQDAPDRDALLLPVDTCFAHLPRLELTAPQAKCVRNGLAFTWQGAQGEFRVYGPAGEFLAVCRTGEGKLITVKSFFDI